MRISSSRDEAVLPYTTVTGHVPPVMMLRRC